MKAMASRPKCCGFRRKGDRIAFFEPDNQLGNYTRDGAGYEWPQQALSRGWQELLGLAWSAKGDEIWFGGAKAGGEPALRAVTMSGKRARAGGPAGHHDSR